jgi:hypothetical protein
VVQYVLFIRPIFFISVGVFLRHGDRQSSVSLEEVKIGLYLLSITR